MPGNDILAGIARKGGGHLLERAIGKALPPEPAAPSARKTLLGGIAGAIAMRVATRSVPGAIVVGGAVLAKKLYDRRRGQGAAPTDAGKTPSDT